MKTMILMDMAACVSCGSDWLSPQYKAQQVKQKLMKVLEELEEIMGLGL